MTTQEVTIIEKEVGPLVKQAKDITIASASDLTNSVEYLSRLNQTRDQWIESKEELTKPINQALKEIRARYKPVEEMLDEAIQAVRDEQSRYHTAEMRRQKEEEAKIANKVAPGKGHISVETAIKKIDAIEKVDQKVATTSGSVSFREVQVLKITDEKKIPRQFLIIDESALLKALKAGEKVSGAELEIISRPINIR